jgi:hypothetical protein
MPEPSLNPAKGLATASAAAKSLYAERRIETRYPFTAAVELIDLLTQARLMARTTDLCRTGCYVDTMNPFPSGTRVRLRITHGELTFETQTTVSYAQPRFGMGIAFGPVDPEQTAVLDTWLKELSGDLGPVVGAGEVADAIQKFPRTERSILSQLVSLLIRKSILTEGEGAALLRELTS